MNRVQTTALLAIVLLPAFSFAQSRPTTLPDRRLLQLTASEALRPGPALSTQDAARPTGLRQRMVRTENETGNPGGPFYMTDKMVYFYSGTRGSATAVHGQEPYSAYDTAYSQLHPATYAYQKFHPSGSLRYSLHYWDNSSWSGPGASRTEIKEYDIQGRLILDSMAQTGQPGTNLDIKNRYGYDNQDRLIYADYAINSNDPGGWDYRLASWKFYNGTDTLPVRDSVLELNDSLVLKNIMHDYNSALQLAADSAYRIGPVFAAGPYEVTLYTYPEPGKQVALLSRRINNGLSPLSRTTISRDNLARETFLQLEDYQGGQWRRTAKRERQYTYASQDETIPTLEITAFDNGGNWEPNSKYRRTFRNDLHIDTLYSYLSTTGVINATTIPSFTAYQYNAYGNLTQMYHHAFLETDGTEINGYYTNFFYEDYEDPLAISSKDKKALAFTVYPNPGLDVIRINTTAAPAAPLSFRLTDIGGGTRMQQTLTQAATAIDISRLSPGVYFLALSNEKDGTSGVQRIVKQ